jgi:hypothetical protein
MTVIQLRRSLTLAMLFVAGACGLDEPQSAQAQYPLAPKPQYDLFYNYYVPEPCGVGAGAELYVSPRPTPPFVGHTYITYQPLLPHEFLYPHHRVYRRYTNGCPLPVNTTRVRYW